MFNCENSLFAEIIVGDIAVSNPPQSRVYIYIYIYIYIYTHYNEIYIYIYTSVRGLPNAGGGKHSPAERGLGAGLALH